MLKSLGVDDWVTEQKRARWIFAAKVVGDSRSKWNVKTLMWEPELDSRHSARRSSGRPVGRWTDDLAKLNERCPSQHNDDNNEETFFFSLTM